MDIIGGLYSLWAKRDGYCESRFFDTLIADFCQYGGGNAEGQQTKGKTFNAGYELFIYAFCVYTPNCIVRYCHETEKQGTAAFTQKNFLG